MRRKKVFLAFLLALASVCVMNAKANRQGQVHGKIVDEDGISLQWVNVECWRQESVITRTQTSTRGEFSFHLTPGDYRLRFTLIGYHPLDSLMVVVASDDTLQLAPLRMSRSGHIDGPIMIGPIGRLILKIMDKSGAPLESVRVTCTDSSGIEKTGVTNLEGMLRFRPLTAGDYTISCHRNGYLSIPRSFVSIKPDQTTHLPLHMIRDLGFGWIRGRIEDSTGIGLQCVNVTCMQGDKRITGTQTNANGLFNLRTRVGNNMLRFNLLGYEIRDSIFVEVAARDTILLAPIMLQRAKVKIFHIQPTYPPLGRILVRIEDSSGAPLKDVVVECLRDSVAVRAETTGLTGKVLFSDMASGTYMIRCSRPGYESIVFPETVIKRGEDTSLVLTLKRKG